MMMHQRRAVIVAGALLSCSVVAACGGGGGGGSAAPGPLPALGVSTPAPTTAPSPTPFPKSIQRSDAQAALGIGKALGSGGVSAGGPSVGAFARRRAVSAGRRPETTQCNPGGSSGVGSTTFEIIPGPNVVENYTDFYDANCTQRERFVQFILDKGSTSSSGGYSAIVVVHYDTTGAVTATATYDGSYSPTTFTMQGTDGTPQNQSGKFGATCLRPSATASVQTCGFASHIRINNLATGLTESFDEQNNAGQTTAQITGSTYVGDALTLLAPTSGTSWSLSNGTAQDALSGTAAISYDGSTATSGTFSITDATGGVSVTGSVTNTVWNVVLMRGSLTLGSGSVNADGDGSIVYADGTTDVVIGFTIVSSH